MDPIALRTAVLLSAQRALIGEVTSAMRAVLVSWTVTRISIRVIFDREIGDDERESASLIETSMLADFLPEIAVACVAEASFMPPRLLHRPAEVFVFLRAEPESG